MSRTSRIAPRTLAALCLTLTCAGCATTPPPPPPVHIVDRPALPATGSEFGVPVTTPPLRAGQDARAAAAQARGALSQANDRLLGDAAFYRDVCRQFASPESSCRR